VIDLARFHSVAKEPHPNEIPSRWQDQQRRAADLSRVGDLHSARAVLYALIDEIEEADGPDSVWSVLPLRQLAICFARASVNPMDPDVEAEVNCLQRALSIARKRLPRDNYWRAEIADRIGTLLSIAGRPDDAFEYLAECLEGVRHDSVPDDFLPALSSAAGIRLQQGRAAEALPLFEELAAGFDTSTNAAVKAFPTAHGLAYYNCGRCLDALGRLDEAQSRFERALQILHDDSHSFLDTIRRELADVRLKLAAARGL